MKNILLISLLVLMKVMSAQNTEPFIDSLIMLQMKYHHVECEVLVIIDVPGMDIPDKQVFIRLEEGKKPKIKSKGLLFFPKKGLFGQLDEILNGAYQAILMKRNTDSLSYKLVSLEEESDWITADILFTYHDYRIHRLLINTRDNGQFYIYHSYDEMGLPKTTKIEFEIKNTKLPLRFLGRQDKIFEIDTEMVSKGAVMLKYQKFEFIEKVTK